MLASVRALLDGILDYAGLFPPAGLPPGQALDDYLAYRAGAAGWMLGRFVCPAARLGELGPLLEQTPAGPPLWLAVVGRGGANAAEFLDGWRADVEAVRSFTEAFGGRVEVGAYEVRLPADLLLPGPNQGLDAVLSCPPGSAISWLEGSPGPDWLRSLEVLIGSAGRQPGAAGCKFRCGGPGPSAIPSPEDLAFVLGGCRDAGVRLKFTAGLHHAIRRLDPALGVPTHGFLNVFVAGVLAHARGLGREQFVPILAETDAASFRFDDEGLRWREWRATTGEIEAARRAGVTSFGSCSFEEPRDDLRALGLLG
ncbi:MAG TPA: hypothetical protein VJ739_05185 [Gemmataceae bacterium]|nr:hypothetical protein [Gemmataceae bacterium]